MKTTAIFLLGFTIGFLSISYRESVATKALHHERQQWKSCEESYKLGNDIL